MPRSDYDYLQQHPLISIINVNWGGIRFIAFSMEIDRRATLEFLGEFIGVDNGIAVARGDETNDYESLGLSSPPPFDWDLMFTQFRYCWTLMPTFYEFDGGLILSVQDDDSRAAMPISLYESNGEANTDGGTLWQNLAHADEFEITGLPVLPKTIVHSNIAAAFNNGNVFFVGPKWFSPQMEWEEIEGGQHASGLSQPQSLEGGDLYFFKNATSVAWRSRGIAMTEAGITEVPVGLATDGGPVPGGEAENPADLYPTVFGEEGISLSAMAITYRGEPWKVVAAIHEPASRPEDTPSFIMDFPGRMWCLAVREDDPDF